MAKFKAVETAQKMAHKQVGTLREAMQRKENRKASKCTICGGFVDARGKCPKVYQADFGVYEHQ
jgi:hypothetical protein